MKKDIYSFLKQLFEDEYLDIYEEESDLEKMEKLKKKNKKKPMIKKTIIVSK